MDRLPLWPYFQIFEKVILLTAIAEKIKQSNHAPLYIKGIGGLGKTTFAQAYTWHNKDNYDKILWVNVIKNNFQAAFYTDEKLIQSLDVGHIKSG